MAHIIYVTKYVLTKYTNKHLILELNNLHSQSNTTGDENCTTKKVETARRCESEQTYIFQSQYPKVQNKPYILSIRRDKENEMVTSDTNPFSVSPSCDFYDASESQKPRTHRYQHN